jgi:hypothetical protein
VITRSVRPRGRTRPIGRGQRIPGRLHENPGHLRDLSGRAGELLQEMTLQIQRIASRTKLGRVRMARRRSMGSNRGCLHTRAALLRLRGGGGGKEHKVLLRRGVDAAVFFVGDRIGRSQGLLGRGRGEPWLLMGIRVERREVERRNVVG